MTEKNFSGESHTSSAVTNGAFDIVALAASAGGLRALSQVLAALPAQFPAAIVVIQHLDPRHRSLMADSLSRRTALQVTSEKQAQLIQQLLLSDNVNAPTEGPE
jgi:two-component system chemotaxis response regulator CheB